MRGGEESNEESREAEEEGAEDEPSENANTEDVCGASSDSQRPSEPSHSSEQRLFSLSPVSRPLFEIILT